MTISRFLEIAEDLEGAGLLWRPEVGDEIADRDKRSMVSILVDPHGMTPRELRSAYLWLPTVEQMLIQFEARKAILFHAGFEITERQYYYKTVIQAPCGHIESKADSFRNSLGIALRDLLITDGNQIIN